MAPKNTKRERLKPRGATRADQTGTPVSGSVRFDFPLLIKYKFILKNLFYKKIKKIDK